MRNLKAEAQQQLDARADQLRHSEAALGMREKAVMAREATAERKVGKGEGGQRGREQGGGGGGSNSPLSDLPLVDGGGGDGSCFLFDASLMQSCPLQKKTCARWLKPQRQWQPAPHRSSPSHAPLCCPCSSSIPPQVAEAAEVVAALSGHVPL